MISALRKAVASWMGRGRWSTITETGTAPAQWTDRNARAFVAEGYAKNPVVFRCVDVIARTVASVPLYVVRPDGAAEPSQDHPLARLLARPNAITDGPAFMHALASWRLLTGNSWAEAIVPGDGENQNLPPLELWVKTPDEMKVLAHNGARMPWGYEWQDQYGGKKIWVLDPVTGRANIMHWRTFSGSNPWYGMSPLEAAARATDQSNAIADSNKKLIDHGGVPRGILMVDGKLAPTQKDDIRQQWQDKYGGANNSGKTPLLDGGLKYQAIGLSPKELDWLESRKWTAQEIAAVYGVPLQVIPLEGSQTFANYEQARLALYEDTALPLLDSLLSALNAWLSPRYPDGAQLAYDRDGISALEPRRRERWAAIQSADFLTINEKRDETGFAEDAQGGGDTILVGAGMVPLAEVATTPDTDPVGDPLLPDDAAEVGNVAGGGMNGAQVTAMLEILDAVSRGTLTRDGAIVAIVAAFPGIVGEAQARRIVAGTRPADQAQE